jgi:GT2 family glycosyltransferase/glycosyltransferase involved in cell wall biosynthesis
MIRPPENTPEERLKATELRIRKLELDLHAAHTRLNQITTSRAWAFLNFFHRASYWLFSAPADARRQKAAKLAERILRKTHLYAPASWLGRLVRPIIGRFFHASASILSNDGSPRGYDVVCLPVIVWNSRFQRPQQLMSQLADRGHRVFYASLRFNRGRQVRLASLRPNVFEWILPTRRGIDMQRELPNDRDIARMIAGIERFRAAGCMTAAVVVVQSAFWTALAERLREQFGWPIVYDCMDDHAGFSTNRTPIVDMEEQTVGTADLVVVTADLLAEKVKSRAKRMTVVRNACDYKHFASDEGRAKNTAGRASGGAPIIGFYGAIAEWFDADLVADLAEIRPEWRFELIGGTQTGDVSRLEKLPNVALLGEKPYAELPRLTAAWDCFLIPFRRIPLTEATNPVKAYEMLAAGKPVVAVDLPELRPMAREGLLTIADDAKGFSAAVERALADDSNEKRERRRAFAAQNTWSDRCDAFDAAVRKLFAPVSIIIVTYNNLGLTQMCLQSVFERTDYPNYEVIAVDNASHDGTPEWLEAEALREPRLRVVCNAENRGFAGANNQGLQMARGEFFCLLNNDTVVTGGWLSTLLGHLREIPGVGIVGPVSNMVGNEAKIPVGYSDIADMPRWAAAYCRRHAGETFPLMMLGFFCVVMRLEVYEKVGPMDEQFGVGYFEDTDYCYRIRAAGYSLRCARDAFVHHWQGASFRLLGEKGRSIYRQNQQLFETKWGADSMAGAY